MIGNRNHKRTQISSLIRRGWCSLFFCAICSLLFVSNSFAQWDSVVVLTNDSFYYRGFVQFVVDSSYQLHVFATRGITPNSGNPPTQLTYQRFDSWGNSLSEQIEIEPAGQQDDYAPAVLLDRSGYIHVVWNRIFPPWEWNWMYMRLDCSGNILTPPTQLPADDPIFTQNAGINMVQDAEGVIWISFSRNRIMAIDEFGNTVVPMHPVLPENEGLMYSMLIQENPTGEVWICGRHTGIDNEDILLVRLDTSEFVTEEVIETIFEPPTAVDLCGFYVDSTGVFHYIIYLEGFGFYYARDTRDGSELDTIRITEDLPIWGGNTSLILSDSSTLLFCYRDQTLDLGFNRVSISFINEILEINNEYIPTSLIFTFPRWTVITAQSGSLWLPGYYRDTWESLAQVSMIHIPSPDEPPPNAVEPSYPVIRDHHIVSVYPNPFNSEVSIEWNTSLTTGGYLQIFNTLGQLVRSYDLSKQQPSRITWDGRDTYGSVTASGAYYFILSQQRAPIAEGKIIYIK